MWPNVRGTNQSPQMSATETRQAFPSFCNAGDGSEERADSCENKGQEVRLVPRMHGAALPDITRTPYVPDIAPVSELVQEAEDYVHASDPLMAGMGDGKGAPWTPEKFVSITGADHIERPAHYARYTIEPCTFILANELPFAEGNVVKYICRWRFKNGREDLEKAKRYIEMILEDLDRKEAGTVTDCVGKPL